MDIYVNRVSGPRIPLNSFEFNLDKTVHLSSTLEYRVLNVPTFSGMHFFDWHKEASKRKKKQTNIQIWDSREKAND